MCSPSGLAYLIGVHLEFTDDFNGDFVSRSCVPGSIDIAEGAISHLLGEDIPLQAGIPGHLVGLLTLFGDNSLDLCISVLKLLVLASGLGSSSSSLGGDVLLTDSSS